MIVDQGMCMLVGIHNSCFKVEQQTWVFNDGDTSLQNSQSGLNRHAVAVVDGMFYHYDGHDETLHQYQLLDLFGDRQQKQKYLIQIEKVYSVKPKFQEEWINRSKHITHATLSIVCICVGKNQCIILRWGEQCSNNCPYLECGGQQENENKSSKFQNDNNSNITVPTTTIKNKNFKGVQRNKKCITWGNESRKRIDVDFNSKLKQNRRGCQRGLNSHWITHRQEYIGEELEISLRRD